MYSRATNIIAICLIAIGMLSGCETMSGPKYVEPENNVLPVIINNANQSRFSKSTWERYTLYAIDDLTVDYSITHRDPEIIIQNTEKEQKTSTRLAEGEHDLIIDVTFKRGRESGPFVAKVPLKLVTEKHRKYILNGEVSGKIVKVWLEYGTGERVSEIGSSEYICTGCGTLVPILIPGQTVPIFIQM